MFKKDNNYKEEFLLQNIMQVLKEVNVNTSLGNSMLFFQSRLNKRGKIR